MFSPSFASFLPPLCLLSSISLLHFPASLLVSFFFSFLSRSSLHISSPFPACSLHYYLSLSFLFSLLPVSSSHYASLFLPVPFITFFLPVSIMFSCLLFSSTHSTNMSFFSLLHSLAFSLPPVLSSTSWLNISILLSSFLFPSSYCIFGFPFLLFFAS